MAGGLAKRKRFLFCSVFWPDLLQLVRVSVLWSRDAFWSLLLMDCNEYCHWVGEQLQVLISHRYLGAMPDNLKLVVTKEHFSNQAIQELFTAKIVLAGFYESNFSDMTTCPKEAVYIASYALSWLVTIFPQVYKKWGGNWKASSQTCRNEEKAGQHYCSNAGTWPRKPVITGIISFEAIQPVDFLRRNLGAFQVHVRVVVGYLSRVIKVLHLWCTRAILLSVGS